MSIESQTPYRVLARKYRPSSFESLIGQEAMVRTLANAIAQNKIAHAFLLTGVRGVGKTSTARIIAKALNCVGPDGQGGPTISPCGQCDPCVAISESRHIDVIEMDAASHTGVDDVREIIEAVQYAAVSARYKIYIIDEVHMLSKSAFNALLKTLEEPPAHVKFIFATTEIQKVPVTVLSRCQRFDLRRITPEILSAHFAHICTAENVTVEDEALALIARAADGSVRDGLSLLDQAIAHGAGQINAQAVRDMLGLSDGSRVRALFAALMAGEAATALDNLRGQYDLGTAPDAIFHALLEIVHAITRAKVAGSNDPGLAREERQALMDWADRLGMGALQRIWQLLLKGLGEVQNAPVPIQAAEMALLRIIHASSLPDPGSLIRRLQSGDSDGGADAPAAAPAARASAPVMLHPAEERPKIPAPANFAELVRLFEREREPLIAKHLHDDVHLVSYAPPRLELRPLPSAGPDVAARVARALSLWTGDRWVVSLSDAPGEPTLRAQEEAQAAEKRAKLEAHPLVRAAFEAFPEAEIMGWGEAAPAPVAATAAVQSQRR